MTGARISDFVTGAPHSQSASFANIDEWGNHLIKLVNGANWRDEWSNPLIK
jgi:hypothetical protein